MKLNKKKLLMNTQYLYYDHVPSYVKYWKDLDCIILNTCFSNGKYICVDDNVEFNDFKKMCEEYELLEKYIKFKYRHNRWCSWCVLYDGLYFNWCRGNDPIRFKCKNLSINEFIEGILKNYLEFYKYDYSQIKPAIANNSRPAKFNLGLSHLDK
jgi:hypothetical protein